RDGGVDPWIVDQENELVAGEPQTMTFDGSASHGGGTCQLSVTLDRQPTVNSTFKTIASWIGGCPIDDSDGGTHPWNYTIPSEVPNGKATLAWSWVSKLSGQPEYYMNCAPITVSGGAEDTNEFDQLEDLFRVNLPSSECGSQLSSDLEIPNPGRYVTTIDSRALAPPTGSGCAALSQATATESSTAAASTSESTIITSILTTSTSVPSAVNTTAAAAASTTSTSAYILSSSPSMPSTAPAPYSNSTSCSTNGALICNGPTQFGLCNFGQVVWQPVAPGTACEDGQIVGDSEPDSPACGPDGSLVCNGADESGLCNFGHVVFQPVAPALFGGVVLSETVRLLNYYGYHNDLFKLLKNRVELIVCILVGFFASRVWEESSSVLASIASSVAFAACGVLFDNLFRSTQRSPISQSEHQNACFRTANAVECPLEARARPNQRLKLAFGIDSCFTSSDERSCKSFRASVEKLLYVAEKNWVNFATTARETAKAALDGGNRDIASLFGVVQLLTLKTTMRVLWPDRDPKQTTNEQIATLAHEVNLQWLRSKERTNSDNPSWLFDQQTSLMDAVKAVFPDWNEAKSNENPCNLILPGYDTMWRVVLRCFVEVKARNHDQAGCWGDVLQNFCEEPTKRQLEARAPQPGPNVAAIHVAKEALRLYPPTRRIYREHLDFSNQKTNVSADVEAMQRDSDVWKDWPNIFNPTRWVGKEEGYDEGYMPFGASPFNCPAKRWRNVPMPFGLSMIALLVGTLIEATDAKWDIHGDFPNKNWPLDTDREAYGAAILRKRRL
ncbi:hypothetical protein KCU96_g6384, partial [Aureobasidium melanogenum]